MNVNKKHINNLLSTSMIKHIAYRRAFMLFIIFSVLLSFNMPVFAQTREDNYRAIMGGWQYYAEGDTICTDDGSGTAGVLEGNNTPGDIYNSGLSGPYILEQFMIHVLKRLSQKYGKPESNFVTEQHTIALVAFAMGEGGDINNKSIFNPMNLGYRDDDVAPVAYAAGGVDGRQSYPSFDQGVEAYARQMSKGTQSRLGTVLSDPTSTAEDFMHALTYYKEYKDNAFWAEASLSNPADYFNGRMKLVTMVQKNYSTTAALIIGTDAYEQREELYNTDLIQFKELLNGDSNVSTTSGTYSSANPCQNTTTQTPTSASGSKIAEIALTEYNQNKGILEYGGDILTYTDGNREAWCADFVSWVYKEAGSPFSGGASGGWRRASVSDIKQYMQKDYTYFNVGEQTPQPGDMAIYMGGSTPDGGSTNHINIVYSVDTSNNTMVTIGGNESNQIMKRTRDIVKGESALVGFARMVQN